MIEFPLFLGLPKYWENFKIARLVQKLRQCTVLVKLITTLFAGQLWLHQVYMKPCLIELQKDYCGKTKLIALDWRWVTLIPWCHKMCDVHSSPVMHNVEGKTIKLLEKLKVLSWKYIEDFLKHILRSSVFASIFLFNKKHNTLILHTCLTSCWSCLCNTAFHSLIPAWFRFVRLKKQN